MIRKLSRSINEDGKPLPILVDILIESIDAISEIKMDFSMTLFIRYTWTDKRLENHFIPHNKFINIDPTFIDQLWEMDVTLVV